MNLYQCSEQWSRRPDDERYVSLIDLRDRLTAARDTARERTISSRALTAIAPNVEQGDYRTLRIVERDQEADLSPTHWSFGQLAELGKAPASYLRTLPAPLAADNINYGLHIARQAQDVKILTHENGGTQLSAATGSGYGRIWCADIAAALVQRFGDGVTGDWKVPGEFGKPVTVSKANTTLYASDRDMFVFLADERRMVDVNGDRPLSSGLFCWNSEVGDQTAGAAMFYFDYACKNRIVWGARELRELRIRHTAKAPDAWADQLPPMLEALQSADVTPFAERLKLAQEARIGDSLADFFARRQFTAADANRFALAHEREEGRPIATVWDAVTAMTAVARDMPHQDARVTLERRAGKLLDLVAA